MAGTFEGLSDLEWQLFADLFPPEPTKRGRGMPAPPFRKVVNTLLYVLITGCRWCDLPRGPQWAPKSAARRWLQRWQADGTLAAMQARILGIAEEHGMVQWQYGAVDGSFSPGTGGGEGIAYGRTGRAIRIHSLTDAAGMPLSTGTTPANGDERAQVLPLLDTLYVRTGMRGRPRKRFKVLAADKGYDAKDLRQRLRRRGIRPQIPHGCGKPKSHVGAALKGPSHASKPSGRVPGASANTADWSCAGDVSRYASTRFSPSR